MLIRDFLRTLTELYVHFMLIKSEIFLKSELFILVSQTKR